MQSYHMYFDRSQPSSARARPSRGSEQRDRDRVRSDVADIISTINTLQRSRNRQPTSDDEDENDQELLTRHGDHTPIRSSNVC
jgi:hypothetical protein